MTLTTPVCGGDTIPLQECGWVRYRKNSWAEQMCFDGILMNPVHSFINISCGRGVAMLSVANVSKR